MFESEIRVKSAFLLKSRLKTKTEKMWK